MSNHAGHVLKTCSNGSQRFDSSRHGTVSVVTREQIYLR